MPSAPAGQLPHAPGGQTPFEALWRTREYLRPYQWQLILMLGPAVGAGATEIVIPLGAAQAALNMLRRWGQASAVTGMEVCMRSDIYEQLQHLDAGFHGSWQS